MLGGCIFLGYMIQHTFIAFFFWTNAMAVNVTRRFSNILQTSQEPETRAMLIGNIVYTQGLPIIISIITALVDSFASCDSIIPNMGYFR